jgi:NAD(P)-dependent dehydrogenase (short-subunit alcohol dehydrogenase family)
MTSSETPPAKIALITGGNRGIGRNSALSLARRGVGVMLTYRSHREEALSAVEEIHDLGVKAVALQLDTGQISTFDAFVAAARLALWEIWGFDRIDFLVNNAGDGMGAPFAETTEAMFDQLMNVHLKGVYFLTQKLLPLLADGGRIVNVSSGTTRYTMPGVSAYASMKGGMETLTRYLAKELGARGIAVNTVAPGAIVTDVGGGRLRNDAAFQQDVATRTALGRIGIPDDVGPVIAALLSEDNRWINGQRIEVSGGANL